MNEKRVKRMRRKAREWSQGNPVTFKKFYKMIKKGFKNERRMASFNPTTN